VKNQSMDVKEAVAYYDSISVKPYVRPFLPEGDSPRPLPPIESILSLNKDMEPYVLQASASRSLFLGTQYKPLQFVHFSDVHGVTELWNRIVEYINHYQDYISFALHTGDYCGDSQLQYVDFYRDGSPCSRPILNCVGNHDTVDGNWRIKPKVTTHEKLFCHTENWGAYFLDIPHSMTYYRDFPDSNLRLIVLDLYYDAEPQIKWLEDRLNEAYKEGLHVITAMHQPSGPITEKLPVTFQSIEAFANDSQVVFEDAIASFIRKGGHYVCNLAGHYHSDWFGYTAQGILNVAVECASDWAGWCEGRRIRGTKTFDCFNVVTVDTDANLIKLVRIGDPADRFLRKKQLLCYNYQTKTVIFNG